MTLAAKRPDFAKTACLKPATRAVNQSFYELTAAKGSMQAWFRALCQPEFDDPAYQPAAARHSFPSGHSSLTISAGLLVTLYALGAKWSLIGCQRPGTEMAEATVPANPGGGMSTRCLPAP